MQYDGQSNGNTGQELRSLQTAEKVKILSDPVWPINNDHHLCDYNIMSLSGVIDLGRVEGHLSCRWNISVPDGFILHIQSTFPLTKSFCPPDATRIYVSEVLANFQPTEMVFCNFARAADDLPFGLTTFTNQVSIQAHYGAKPYVDGSLFYQAIRESEIDIVKRSLEETEEGSGSGEGDLDEISGLSNDDYCLLVTGATVRSGNAAVNSSNCTLTIELENVGELIILKFLEIALSVPLNTTSCADEDSFILVRTWELEDAYQDAYVCTPSSVGSEFTSSVRIQVFYQPSEHVSHGFRASYRRESEETGTVAEEGATDAHDTAIRKLWEHANQHFPREHTLVRFLQDDHGTLSSIGYPHFYAKFRMRWAITVEPGRKISVQWVDIDLGYTPRARCSRSVPKITIIYTPPDGDKVVYCGVYPPETITSKSERITILFDPKGGVEGRGVEAHYTSFFDPTYSFRSNFGQENTDSQDPHTALVTSTTSFPPTTETPVSSDCQVLTEPSGTFSTPNYSLLYPSNYSFCWEVRSELTEAISLRFEGFSLDSATIEPCDTSYSYVNVSDFIAYTILCGSGVKPIFTSFTNRLKVSFNARLGRGPGFRARYHTFTKTMQQGEHFIISGCNATETLERSVLKGSAGLPALMSRCQSLNGRWPEWDIESWKDSEWLASPSFPERHPSPSHCTWVIRGKEGQIVNVRFQNLQSKDPPGTVSDCNGANVTLSFKDCVTGDQQTLCGDDITSNDLLFANSIEIEFISRIGNSRGFQIFYKLEEADADGLTFRTLPRRTTTESSFPVSTTSTQLPPAPLTTEIFIEIFTEIVTEDPLCQDADSEMCGGDLVSDFGSFSSQSYPNDFLSEATCWWTINSPSSNRNVALKFLDIDLGVKSAKGLCDTRYSYITVNSSRRTYVLCDDQGPNMFISDSGVIDVGFSSLYSSGRGFCAAFMSVDSQFNGSLADLHFPCVCENLVIDDSKTRRKPPSGTPAPDTCQFLISGNSGTLPSADFPSPYLPNSECIWTLLAEPGYLVRLAFLHLDLDDSETRGRCLLSDTHVQVSLFDGDNVLQIRFCSVGDLAFLIPSARAATVIFKSRNIQNHDYTGFNMSYVFVKTQSEEINENPITTAASNSLTDIGFRVFDESSVDSWFSDSDYGDLVESGRKTPQDDRTRLRLPVDSVSNTTTSKHITTSPTEISTIYRTDSSIEFDPTSGEVGEQLGDKRMSTTGSMSSLPPVIIGQPISLSTGDKESTMTAHPVSPTLEDDPRTTSFNGGLQLTTSNDVIIDKEPLIPDKGE